MPRADILIKLLRREAQRSSSVELYARLAPLLDDLSSALGRLEYVVEHDEDEAYFDSVPIVLGAWLAEYHQRFVGEFGEVEVEIDFSASGVDAMVRAAPFWLTTVFWNLWKNAMDAVGPKCRITLVGIRDAKNVRIVLLDNGGGFKAEDQDRMFTMRYSTKGEDSGRGHMEVADAMRRLGGTASIVRHRDASYRIELTFPRSET